MAAADRSGRTFSAFVAVLGGMTLVVVAGLLVPDFVARGRADEAHRKLRVGMTKAEVLAAVQPLEPAIEDCNPAASPCGTLKLEFRCWAYSYAISVYFGPDGRTLQASQVRPVMQ